MKRAKTWTRGIVPIMLPLLLLLISSRTLAQFQLRSDGVSALGGAASASGTNVLAVVGQPHPIETSSSSNAALNPGFIPTLARVTPGSNPMITSINPNSGQQGQTLSVTIIGANFVSGASVAFSGAGIMVNSANVTSATQIATNISVAASTTTGSRDVIVTNPDGGSGTGAGLFTVLPAVGGATIKPVVASPQQVGVEFTVDVTINDVQNLFGVSFVLNYDTSVLDVVTPTANNVLPGPFLGNNVIFLPNVDEANGKVNIGVTRTAGQNGVNGNGVVAQIKFKSLSSTPSGTVVDFSLSNIAGTDPTGNPIVLTAFNTLLTLNDGIIIWPGDTNNDGVVNQADILPLGLRFGQTGPPRQNASMSWIGQPATPWSNIPSTYVDANGDGAINQGDVLAIGLNFGRTHTGSSLIVNSIANPRILNYATAESLRAIITGDSNPGQDFFIDVQTEQVTNLFGISYELVYSPVNLVDPQTIEAGNFLGNDILFLPNANKNTGKISIGITRTGQGGVTGTGIVTRIKMHVSSQAQVNQMVTLTFQNVTANDQNGQSIQITPVNRSIKLKVESSQNGALPENFELHPNTPNPFNPATRIQYDLPKTSTVTVEIFSVLGKHVRTLFKGHQPAGSYSVVWDGRDENGTVVASGVFIYQLRAGRFVQSRKMLFLQ